MFVLLLHLYRCRWLIDCSGRCSHYIDLVIEPNSRSWSTTFWAMVGSFERVIPFSLQVHPTRWNDSVNQPDSPAASFGSFGWVEWSKPRKSKFFFLDWNAANAVCAINSQSLFDTAFSGSVWCIRRELWIVSIIASVDSNRSDWYRNWNTERRLDFVVCSVCSFFYVRLMSCRYKQIRSGETQKGRGTGLGLSLSLYIVCLHQGIIRVITESQVGSTFEIYLPLLKTEGDTIPTEQDAVPKVIEEKIETIAVVDDQLSIRQLVQSCLKRLGYTVCFSFHSNWCYL